MLNCFYIQLLVAMYVTNVKIHSLERGGRQIMPSIFGRLLGRTAIDKEIELAKRLEQSGATNVEVIGRGAVVTSKEDLAASNTVKLMRVKAREIISEQENQDATQDKEL